MGFVTKFLNFIDFSVEDRFEILAGDRKNDIDVFKFQLGFRHVDLIFSLDGFVFQQFDFLLWF